MEPVRESSNLNHLNCSNVDKTVQQKMNVKSAQSWTCNKCLIQEQPFYNIANLNALNKSVLNFSEIRLLTSKISN